MNDRDPLPAMRLSNYLLTCELPDGRVRLMSTLSRAIVDLERRYYTELSNCVSSLSPEVATCVQKLKELRILVDSSKDEFAAAKETIQSWKCPDTLSITYCLTYNCNMSCVYCIQSAPPATVGLPQRRSTEDVVGFIKKCLRYYGLDALEVCFFGGEPMLDYIGVCSLMIRLRAAAEDLTKQPPSFHMVSNGTLLSPSRIELLAGLGLQEIQFTIDGLPEMHERRRRLRGRSSWGTIWENILAAAANGMKTSINAVIDEENVAEIVPMLNVMEELATRKPELKEHAEVVLSLLIPTEEARERSSALLYGREKEILLEILEGYKLARDRGWNTANWFFVQSSARESHRTYIVGPDGALFKCFGTIGDASRSIGSIDDPMEEIHRNSVKIADLDLWDEECESCPILPLCRGGCQAIAALSHDGEFGHKLCEKDVWLPVMRKALEYEFC